MVSTYSAPQPFFRQTPLAVDTADPRQKYYEDDDGSTLGESLLGDQNAMDSGLELSPQIVDSRRESFAVGPSLFSSKQDDWQAVDMQSVPSNNPFLDQPGHNPFMSVEPHQQPSQQPFAQQGQSWSIGTSGPATPLQQFDGLPADFETAPSMFQPHRGSVQGHTPFTNPTNHVPMFQTLGHHQIPSPQDKEHWMSQHGQAAAMFKNKMRPNSPSIRSHNELRRGDGIRKKNARFEIPAERNLNNIDELIAQSTDEVEIKELKQQKRLLRNRQAALDSRQRKKQHTERLEDEKKHFTAVIAELEEDVERLRLEVQDLLTEKQGYNEYIEKLNFEKEDMIRAHTIETGELRKKVNVLTNHVQALEGSALPLHTAHQHPGPFADPIAGMQNLNMDGSWGGLGGFLNDYSLDQQQTATADVSIKQEMQMVAPLADASKKAEFSLAAEAEKPASQGGLLFMLFLVGAFVLGSRQTPSIPRVSEDMRAASASLLENVLKDAGVSQGTRVAPSTSALADAAPRPSAATSWPPAPVTAMTGLDGVTPSMLGDLSDSLTQPTQQQQNEQLFSLSAAQYNSVSGTEFLPPSDSSVSRSTSQGRRNLAEALANIRSSSNKAEVYTRSLLWDQIPSDVVRKFAQMVAETHQHDKRQEDANETSDGITT